MDIPHPEATLTFRSSSENLFDLSGYCSIVTGAGQGIGLTLSKGLAYNGSDLVLTDISAESLQKAAEEIRTIGRNVATVPTDIAADGAPEWLVKAAKEVSGRVDVLINNAGIMGYADMLTVTDDQWDTMYSVNLRAPMRIMRAVLQEMVKAGRGSVINIRKLLVFTGLGVQSGWGWCGLLLGQSSLAVANPCSGTGCRTAWRASKRHCSWSGRHAHARSSSRLSVRIRNTSRWGGYRRLKILLGRPSS